MKDYITVDGDYEGCGITIHSTPVGFLITYANGNTAAFETLEEAERSLAKGFSSLETVSTIAPKEGQDEKPS